jgi:tripartite-type tricarboxylate transporter receptor subunit TctC
MRFGMLLKRLLPLLSFTLIAAGSVNTASAQSYPSKPIRIVVPFVAGGSVDTIARLIGVKLSENLGQPVIVENRGGAGGNLGADFVAKSAPDGYTMLLATTGHAISASLYKTLPFDPVKDFVPVTQVIESNFVFVSSPRVAASTVGELVTLAKAKPGGMNYGSSGAGGPLHLGMEILKNSVGIDVVHVPYRGDALLYAALMAGEIQMAMAPLSTGVPQVQGSTIRGLAVTGSKRSPQLPEVPTFQESGIRGLENSSWQSLFMPAKTPHEIVLKMQREVAKVVRTPEVAARLRSLGGAEPVGGTSEEFDALFKADVERFARVIQQSKIEKVD